ncbi:MAG: hypothetical protein O2783_03015 [Chloroflexi bacterium]|nr:hypothetical protein [Chloroflexota bacterium]
MKISQIMVSTGPTEEGLPPLQGMLLAELNRRPDEVFDNSDEGLLQIFPRLKRSSLSWSLYLLHKKGLISKRKVRVNGRLTTVFGSHEAVEALKGHLNVAD